VTKHKPAIEVAATADSTTARLANAICRDHHMCPRCAAAAASAALVVDNTQSLEFCSDACAWAYDEFWEEVEVLEARVAAPSSSRRDH
jgi:hypothetical protein